MKRKILIADDDSAVCRTVSRTLGADLFSILTVSNGDDALSLAVEGKPDIILLDVNMPRKSGWEVLKELRHNVQTRMTPVILLTGLGAVADKLFGLDTGADDYVTKPFVADELRARVNSALRRHQLGVSANPLTKLPGSPTIEEETVRRIRDGIPFAFLYVDINHFKPYNDNYGFASGDRVLRETADILLEGLRSEGNGEEFLGHIGGDDFVMITKPDRAAHVARHIATRFDEKASGFYSAPDFSRGHIETENRLGMRQRIPTISLSIGIAISDKRKLSHYAQVVKIASEMKAFCKVDSQRRHSRFAFDQRRAI